MRWGFCWGSAQVSCVNLVLSSHLRSGLINAKACKNKEQKERKLFLWVSEATDTGTASIIVILTEMRPSFVISNKTGAVQFLPLLITSYPHFWSSRKVFVNPWGRAHRLGKRTVQPPGFQTQNQTVHISLTPHMPILVNKMNENNNQASQVLPNLCCILQ